MFLVLKNLFKKLKKSQKDLQVTSQNKNHSLIMGSQELEDKKLIKQYGKNMRFTYGCKEGQCDIYVYRIAHVNEDGCEIDLNRCQVETRCEQLGLKVVPLLVEPFLYDGDKEKLGQLLHKISDGPSTIDNTHIREGVVVKVEHKDMCIGLKYKGDSFCELESIRKNDPLFVDIEDVS